MVAPAVALLSVTLWPVGTVPPAGENTGAATVPGAVAMVKVALVTPLDSAPLFTACAFTVVVAVMTMAAPWTGDVGPGSLPVVGWRMFAPPVALVMVPAWPDGTARPAGVSCGSATAAVPVQPRLP